MVEIRVHDDVAQIRAPGSEWLSTGWNGGRWRSDVAYNVTVPEGWSRTDLGAYVDERLAGAGFDGDGPALLTGVEMRHARIARIEVDPDDGADLDGDSESVSVAALATAGVTNPAALYPDVETERAGGESGGESAAATSGEGRAAETVSEDASTPPSGTVNVLLHVERPLAAGALSNLVAVTAEARATTLLRETGFPGTTTDAVIVGSRALDGGDGDGDSATDPAQFTGSATPIGSAARACVRDAVRASLASRYEETAVPESVADADHGVVTTRSADVSEPQVREPSRSGSSTEVCESSVRDPGRVDDSTEASRR